MIMVRNPSATSSTHTWQIFIFNFMSVSRDVHLIGVYQILSFIAPE